MGGIAGLVGWDFDEERSDREIRAICARIRHRGPEAEEYFVAAGISLGMRRLHTLAPGGAHFELGNEAGSVHVISDSAISNSDELQQRLRCDGHRLGTASDPELIAHLYEDEGIGLLQSLRGAFSFALWDERRQRLLLARDRLGLKPLYYWEAADGLAFASELRALRILPGFPATLDQAALADYLALGYVPDPDCIFQGVYKLAPGHLLSWERGQGSVVERYWSPFRPEDPTLDEYQACEELRRLLTESVACHLRTEHRVGAFLSGGIDSSAVVAEMARQLDHPVKTFAIGFPEPEFNEAPNAAAVAFALGTEHRELIVRPDIDDLLEEVVAAFDEPFADSSAIPTYLAARLAREDVAVVLAGDGGDELFGGYSRYLDLERRNRPLPPYLRRALGYLAQRLPHATRGRNRLLELSRGPIGRYAGMVALPLSSREGGVASPTIASAGKELDDLLTRWFELVPDRDLLAQASFVDMLSYLPGDICTKVDRMCMSVSLESRAPLLDHRLVEFAAIIPSSLKFRDGVGKWIFRKAIAELVPSGVLERPKRGFGIPINIWFRQSLRHRVEGLRATNSVLATYTDSRALERIIREHQRGRRDHSPLIWRLLVLQIWLESNS